MPKPATCPHKTLVFYTQRLSFLVEAAGERLPSELSTAQLRLFVQHFREQRGWSVGTTNHAIRVWKVFYSFLEEVQCARAGNSNLFVAALQDTYSDHPLPTAFACLNDYWAYQVLHFTVHRGLHVPRDVSILGYGNFLALATSADPLLTSIETFPEKLGSRALALLLQRIRDGKPFGQYAPQVVTVEPTMIIRQSCAPPRRTSCIPASGNVSRRAVRKDLRRKRCASTIPWRAEDTEEALEHRFHTESSGELRPRWQALWLLRQGQSRRAVAQTLGISVRTLCYWLAWYQEGGTAAIARHLSGGASRRSCRLSEAQRQHLVLQVTQGTLHSIREASEWTTHTYGITYSYWGMRDLLERLGVRGLVQA
jgi:transposase